MPFLYRIVRLQIDSFAYDLGVEYESEVEVHDQIKPRNAKRELLITVMGYIRRYTKDLRLVNKHPAPLIQDTMRDVIRSLTGAKLQRLRLFNISIHQDNADLFGSLLSDPDSSLCLSLKELRLPTYYNTTKEPAPMMDCSVKYTFTPTNSQNAGMVCIDVTGVPEDDGDDEDEHDTLKGTSLRLQQQVLDAFGTGNGFSKIKITSHQRPVHHILDVIEASPGKPLPITKLSFKDTDLQADLSTAFFQRVDISSIKKLAFFECTNFEPVFNRLLLVPGSLVMTQLVVENWLTRPMWKRDVSGNIEDFLSSFSTLKHLSLIVCESWKPYMVKILGKHDVNVLILNFGRRDFQKDHIVEIRKLCPNVKVLGLRSSSCELPFHRGYFTDTNHRKSRRVTAGFDTKFRPIAHELAKFASLYKVWVSMNANVTVPRALGWDRDWWPTTFLEKFEYMLDTLDSHGIVSCRIFRHIHDTDASSQVSSINLVDKPYPILDWSQEKLDFHVNTPEEDFKYRYYFEDS